MLLSLIFGFVCVGFPSALVLRSIIVVVENARRRCEAGTAKMDFLNSL
jgi:hypothetical protein